MKMLTDARRIRLPSNDPQLRSLLELAGSFLGGFCLSAANFADLPQPFCLGVLCGGLPGWLPMSFALGSSLGYWLFWGTKGLQGLIWLAAGLPVCIWVRRTQKLIPALISVLAALIVASSGVVFQVWQGEQTAIFLYLMRIFVAFGAATLAQLVALRREPVADGLAAGIGVLALAQMGGMPYLNPGFAVAGFLALDAPFPTVAMAGLALDLTGTTPVPMTAVLCVVYLIRLVPKLPQALLSVMPVGVYLGLMLLCARQDFLPVPALALGALVFVLLPRRRERLPMEQNRALQQRLELVSGVLAQTEQLLQEAPLYPLDEGSLISRAADRACGDCPCGADCRERVRIPYLPITLLHDGLTPEQLPAACEKKGRLFLELQRSQDQFRLLRADRLRQQEYRAAVMQQYGFLSEYLRGEAGHSTGDQKTNSPRFHPEVAVCTRGKEATNGDKCLWFAGTENRYFVLLCDGMGTGEGAAFESRTAANLLRRLLVAGFPAQYALRSLNSLCILRGSAGAVTVDLAEAELATGRVTLYKWGAAPSWLLAQTGAERIGTEGPPPGLAMEGTQETVDRFSLEQGAALVMLSDGVDGEGALGALEGQYDQPAGFLAALLLEAGNPEVPDDATAAVIRLQAVGN